MENISVWVSLWLSSVAVSTGLALFGVWLTRAWISERLKNAIKNEYDQKLETHKAELKARADTEAERLRAQLNMAAAEHQIRFAKFHEKRAEVIAELYALIVGVHDAVGLFVSMGDEFDKDETPKRYDAARAATHKFLRYLDQHRLYVPAGVCAMLENFEKEIKKQTQRLFAMTRSYGTSPETDKEDRGFNQWIKTHRYLEEELPKTRAALEKEFRVILCGHNLES